MEKRPWRRRASAPVVLFLVAVLLPLAALAQERSDYVNVAIVKVKTDMVGEFEDLQKELSAAVKKAGGSRYVWEVVRGPYREFHAVTPVDKIGQFAGIVF